jgi:iron(III) transport system ATP-binding protein
MLTVSGLVKTFSNDNGRQLQAVRGVSFEVEAGSFFTILGPSGCGKSTILRCLAGLERPDSGSIEIDGQVVFGPRGEVPTVDRPIAMVFQSYAIWPHMTVFDNAAFPLRYGRHRLPGQKRRERVMDMLQRLELADYAQSWATQLSGGQQQRLALARALLCDPKLLLLDEPLSNLDARLRASLRAELKSFQKLFGVTSVYVTHDQAEALAMSDQIAVMSQGTIQQVDDPQSLYDRPKTPFVANFIGHANLVEASRADGGLATPFGMVACAPSADDRVTLSVRPEHVRLHTQQPSGVNVFGGKVASSDFLGDHREVVVDVGPSQLRALALPEMALSAGAEVWVELPPERITVLPSTPAATAPALA